MGEEKDLGIYEASFTKAAEALRRSDILRVCDLCGAVFEGDRVVLRFFADSIAVSLPGVVFEPPAVPVFEQILLLHYLTTLGNAPSSGAHVSFKNLPGASFYESAYRRRGPERIVRLFGGDFEGFRRAVTRLGGVAAGKGGAAYGDLSGTLPVLPRVEAIVVLFGGDEEFQPEANILYKDDIVNFLPLEDIAVLSGLIASRLKKAGREGGP
jgi:hypothetical protein